MGLALEIVVIWLMFHFIFRPLVALAAEKIFETMFAFMPWLNQDLNARAHVRISLVETDEFPRRKR